MQGSKFTLLNPEKTLYKQFKTQAPEEVSALAREILTHCSENRIFAIQGDLGAGKTTLVKAICEALGSTDVVKSPTFAIVNEYEGDPGQIYHFDFYRIKRLEEVYDLGYEEYFYSGSYCFIEWPELVEDLIPENAARISIEITGPLSRNIEIAL